MTLAGALAIFESKVKATGYASVVTRREPSKAVQDGTCAVIGVEGFIDEAVLDAPREVHIVTVRRYVIAGAEPEANIDDEMELWRDALLTAFWGDFNLGDNIAHGLPTETRWELGYGTLERTLYRFMDLTIGWRVDVAYKFVQ